MVYDNNNVLWPDENPGVDYDNMEFFYQDYDYSLADCLVYNSWEEACLCSIDYQGILCEENNQVLCDYEYQYSGGQDGQQCDYDKYRYNPDIGGDPPCNLVEGGEKFNLNFKLQCRNEEQNKIEKLELKNADFWTIHWDKKVQQDSNLVLPDSSRYNYELYEEYTVQNANGEDGEYILARVVKPDYNVKKTAINWQILSKSFVFENQSQGLSIDQLIGKDNLQLEIDLSSIPEDYIYQGRYSLEVDIKSEKNNETEYSIINQIRLFLDSQSYKIPKADNGFNFWIILIIIIAFLVVLAIVLYIVYKKYQIKGQRLLKIHNMKNAKKQQQYQEQSGQIGGTFSGQE
ncbi:hypothetical protein PPERSA_00278 [Pseudocohnilembus persalinus]|uniref:Transmembrane protein n=1 Tax=Pseudocohnilembus persalinus TaxID=266149 RepID=A0A0V0Q8W8_PSEPJ|nr:hypothetical protein PPERSA_00278 [Pseudocohnilembus persalinus]|eukprot:KRW98690.1 hypothetical protein PPERSA_00278 [Pseudocohnilembus persalinus]